jgi:hypothetical protein
MYQSGIQWKGPRKSEEDLGQDTSAVDEIRSNISRGTVYCFTTGGYYYVCEYVSWLAFVLCVQPTIHALVS